jgi:hypothetical protein
MASIAILDLAIKIPVWPVARTCINAAPSQLPLARNRSAHRADQYTGAGLEQKASRRAAETDPCESPAWITSMWWGLIIAGDPASACNRWKCVDAGPGLRGDHAPRLWLIEASVGTR